MGQRYNKKAKTGVCTFQNVDAYIELNERESKESIKDISVKKYF